MLSKNSHFCSPYFLFRLAAHKVRADRAVRTHRCGLASRVAVWQQARGNVCAAVARLGRLRPLYISQNLALAAPGPVYYRLLAHRLAPRARPFKLAAPNAPTS